MFQQHSTLYCFGYRIQLTLTFGRLFVLKTKFAPRVCAELAPLEMCCVLALRIGPDQIAPIGLAVRFVRMEEHVLTRVIVRAQLTGRGTNVRLGLGVPHVGMEGLVEREKLGAHVLLDSKVLIVQLILRTPSAHKAHLLHP